MKLLQKFEDLKFKEKVEENPEIQAKRQEYFREGLKKIEFVWKC